MIWHLALYSNVTKACPILGLIHNHNIAQNFNSQQTLHISSSRVSQTFILRIMDIPYRAVHTINNRILHKVRKWYVQYIDHTFWFTKHFILRLEGRSLGRFFWVFVGKWHVIKTFECVAKHNFVMAALCFSTRLSPGNIVSILGVPSHWIVPLFMSRLTYVNRKRPHLELQVKCTSH